MLSTFFQQRLGPGFILRPDTAALSLAMGAQSKQRRDAVEAAIASRGRPIQYGRGRRIDAAQFGKTEVEIRANLGGRLLYEDHLRAGSHLVDRMDGRSDADIPQASQALTFIYERVYQIEHAGLAAWDEQILKIDRSVDPAAEQYVWYEKDLIGAPRAASTYDITTIPMVVGPVAAPNLGRIVPALVGFETNFMDDRRTALARRNGKPDFQIEAGKIDVCKQVIAEFFNAAWLYGDVALGIDGLHSSPVVRNIPSPSNTWANLTPQQLADELNKLFNFIPNTAQGGVLGDIKKVRLLLPPSQYDRIHEPTFANTQGMSVWAAFRDSHGLKDDQVVKVFEFASANSAVYTGGPLGLSADRAYVIYDVGDEWDPTFVMSQPIEIPVPPRQTGVGEVTYMHARGGGIKIPDGRRIAYYEGL